MLSVGIDTVEINRFKSWGKFNYKQLSKVFSNSEIAYSLRNKAKFTERLSARFATKEALFKALTPLLIKKLNFFTLCQNSSLEHSTLGNPEIMVNWEVIGPYLASIPKITCSITHTRQISTSIIILF